MTLMRSFPRVLLAGALVWCLAAAPASAGSLELAPAVEMGAGYDGNFFLDEDAAARVAAYPLRGSAEFAAAWLPSLRSRAGARAGYTLQRLFADPPLGNVQIFEGSLDATVRPSFWSYLAVDAWGVESVTAGSDDIAFLDGTELGGRLSGGYRFAWATLGAELTAGQVDYAAQAVTGGVERSDGYVAAGLSGAWEAAGRWRLALMLSRNESAYHPAAYRAGDVRVTYAHDLWDDADAGAEVAWRTKRYEEAGRSDQRWRLGISFQQWFTKWLALRAAAAQSLNRSNAAGNDYEWTLFECVLTVRPRWSYYY